MLEGALWVLLIWVVMSGLFLVWIAQGLIGSLGFGTLWDIIEHAYKRERLNTSVILIVFLCLSFSIYTLASAIIIVL